MHRPVGEHPAVGEHDQPVDHGEQRIEVVRDQEHRYAEVIDQEAHELVEGACRDRFQLAVLVLEIGDRETYRAHCQKMVARFRATNLPGPLGETAEACLLVAEPGPDSEVAGQLADQAFSLGKNSFWVYYVQFVKGLAEYRAGHYASAVDWVDKCIGQPTMVSGPRPDGPAYLVQAMAQHKLKRSDEARAALAKAADIVNAKLLKVQDTALDENWIDWLIAEILLREAQALIDPPAATPKEKRTR